MEAKSTTTVICESAVLRISQSVDKKKNIRVYAARNFGKKTGNFRNSLVLLVKHNYIFTFYLLKKNHIVSTRQSLTKEGIKRKKEEDYFVAVLYLRFNIQQRQRYVRIKPVLDSNSHSLPAFPKPRNYARGCSRTLRAAEQHMQLSSKKYDLECCS